MNLYKKYDPGWLVRVKPSETQLRANPSSGCVDPASKRTWQCHPFEEHVGWGSLQQTVGGTRGHSWAKARAATCLLFQIKFSHFKFPPSPSVGRDSHFPKKIKYVVCISKYVRLPRVPILCPRIAYNPPERQYASVASKVSADGSRHSLVIDCNSIPYAEGIFAGLHSSLWL